MVNQYILKDSYKSDYVWSRCKLHLCRKIQGTGLGIFDLYKLEMEDSLYFECIPVDNLVGYQYILAHKHKQLARLLLYIHCLVHKELAHMF